MSGRSGSVHGVTTISPHTLPSSDGLMQWHGPTKPPTQVSEIQYQRSNGGPDQMNRHDPVHGAGGGGGGGGGAQSVWAVLQNGSSSGSGHGPHPSRFTQPSNSFHQSQLLPLVGTPTQSHPSHSGLGVVVVVVLQSHVVVVHSGGWLGSSWVQYVWVFWPSSKPQNSGYRHRHGAWVVVVVGTSVVVVVVVVGPMGPHSMKYSSPISSPGTGGSVSHGQ